MAKQLNHSLNTTWVDTVEVGKRNDDLVFIRFLTNLPEGVFEQMRIITGEERLRDFVDKFCDVLDYYPREKEK